MRKKRQPEENAGGANWMDTYGDLVTLLLCFFVLLYSFSSIDSEKWEMLVKSFAGSRDVMENSSVIGPEDYKNIIGRDDTLPVSPTTTQSTTTQPTAVPTDVPTPFPTAVPSPVPTLKPKPTSAPKPTPIPEYIVGMEKMSNEIAGAISKSSLGSAVTIERTQSSIRIRLIASIIFEPGSDQLKPEATGLLLEVLAVVSPYASLVTSMHTEGHTDSVTPIDEDMSSKWDLAGRRATRVLEVLLANSGVSQSVSYTQGFGDQRPIAGNDTDAGRDLNNRVDILLSSQAQ